jgi:ABC-type transporter Mla subunit MlaD
MTQIQIGSISTRTLRPQDLLETFAATLNQLDKANPLIAKALDTITNDAEESADTGSEVIDARVAAYELVNELADAIQEHCPPFVRFGAHEGDGADFGFWVDHEALNEALQDPEYTLINGQLYSVPRNEAVLIQNHGTDDMTVMDMERNVLWSTL